MPVGVGARIKQSAERRKGKGKILHVGNGAGKKGRLKQVVRHRAGDDSGGWDLGEERGVEIYSQSTDFHGRRATEGLNVSWPG